MFIFSINVEAKIVMLARNVLNLMRQWFYISTKYQTDFYFLSNDTQFGLPHTYIIIYVLTSFFIFKFDQMR